MWAEQREFVVAEKRERGLLFRNKPRLLQRVDPSQESLTVLRPQIFSLILSSQAARRQAGRAEACDRNRQWRTAQRLTTGHISFGFFTTTFIPCFGYDFYYLPRSFPDTLCPKLLRLVSTRLASVGPTFQRRVDRTERAYLIIVRPNGCEQRSGNGLHSEGCASEF